MRSLDSSANAALPSVERGARRVLPCGLGWLRPAKKSPPPEEWVALPRRRGWSDTAKNMSLTPVAASVAAGERARTGKRAG